MLTFKIWRLGSTEPLIEEGSSAMDACEKAGWRLEECEVELIPESQIIRCGAPPAEAPKLDALPADFGYAGELGLLEMESAA